MASEALALFDGEELRKKTFIADKWPPVVFGIFGFGTACAINWATRRPLLAGLQKHFLATGIGALVGSTGNNWRNTYNAERDAVFRHYIELHPEDFQFPERKKYADVLEAWVPIR